MVDFKPKRYNLMTQILQTPANKNACCKRDGLE